MKRTAYLLCMLSATPLFAAEPNYPKAKVSFSDFQSLVAKVESHRAERLIDFDRFLEMSTQENVVILDTRSKFRYDRIHLKGAKHLNYSDFTQANLAELIPDRSTTILIYCNNNFADNQTDFASKVAIETKFLPVSMEDLNNLGFSWNTTSAATNQPATPSALSSPVLNTQFKVQEKPLMMALNVPTYINLYGYGYHNVYELDELVNVNDPRVSFEGSLSRQSDPISQESETPSESP